MPVAFQFCLTQPGRAAELARKLDSYARTSRVVIPMLQRSSRASPMVQPVASDHRESSCMPGCHGKHPPQPANQSSSPVMQTTRDELRVPDEGARPSGDHLRPSGGPIRSRPDTVRLWTRAADQPGEHPLRLESSCGGVRFSGQPQLGPNGLREPLSNLHTPALCWSVEIAQRAGCGKAPSLGVVRKIPLSRVLFNHLCIKRTRVGCNKPGWGLR